MPFEVGREKTGGRQAGTPNKRTQQWLQLGEAIATTHTERFNEILGKMDDDNFTKTYLQVLEYFQPKLQRSEIKHEGEIKTEILSGIANASTDDLKRIVEEGDSKAGEAGTSAT